MIRLRSESDEFTDRVTQACVNSPLQQSVSCRPSAAGCRLSSWEQEICRGHLLAVIEASTSTWTAFFYPHNNRIAEIPDNNCYRNLEVDGRCPLD